MNAAVNTPQQHAKSNIEPVLRKVLKEAKREHKQLQQTFQLMGWGGLPLINTLILVTSGITMEIAHHGLKHGKRGQLNLFLVLTVLLGSVFLGLQALEYVHAYQDMNLTLESGIYGSTFFMLTGFHGMHVTLGTIMLIVMFLRVLKGHFTPESHFAFQATSWYWHFVDVVWIFLFPLLYIAK